MGGIAGDIAEKNSFNAKNLFEPISRELKAVVRELKQILARYYKENRFTAGIADAFFKNTGKLLRPGLVILSARSMENGRPVEQDLLIKLAVAVELIHNASLIHDDIIDGSKSRRGKPVLNLEYSNQIAVLIGDLLYTCALDILNRHFDREIVLIIVDCIKQMADSEIFNLFKKNLTDSEYSYLIKSKTAVFMSSCCITGAMLATDDKEKIGKIAGFGLNFGMAYQLIDDYKDRDVEHDLISGNLENARQHICEARQDIGFLPESVYKKSLEFLTDCYKC